MTVTTQPVPVAVASSPADAAAVQAVEQHHAALAATLSGHVAALLRHAADGGDAFAAARQRAGQFLSSELAPHAAAEEQALYPAAARIERAALLIDGMLAEHRAIARLVDEVTTVDDPVRSAAAAYSLQVLFEVHLAKENDLVLPLVAADPTTSLSDVLSGMHDLLGGHEEPAPVDDASHHTCGCGERDAGVPELDVRTVPHAIRHATVFGAFDAVPAGGSLLLVAPHDPLPLLRQLAERAGGAVSVSYEQRGPDAWRLLLTRS